MFAMKFYERPEFKSLNAEWRKKLRRSKFDDLEDDHGNITPLVRELNRDPRVDKSTNAAETLDFFLKLDEWLQTKPKICTRHKRILEMYSQGQTPTEIAERKDISRRMVTKVITKARCLIFGHK